MVRGTSKGDTHPNESGEYKALRFEQMKSINQIIFEFKDRKNSPRLALAGVHRRQVSDQRPLQPLAH